MHNTARVHCLALTRALSGDQLGEGGFSYVFLVQDESGAEYALKKARGNAAQA